MSSQQSPERRSKQPTNSKSPIFDYAALAPETRIVVQQRTSEIKTLMRRTASDTVDIGQKLTEVKQQLGHGNFMSWLKSEFNWSVSAATRFMQVSEQFKFVNLVNRAIAPSALYELATPSTPTDARLEAIERANQGEAITYSKAKEIVNRYQKQINPDADQSVTTIDVDALSLETESSATVTQPQLPLATVEAGAKMPQFDANQSIAFRVNDQSKAIPKPTSPKIDSLKLDENPNHSSVDKDERSSRNSRIALPTELNPSDICTLFVTNVEDLTQAEVEIVWQAFAHRLNEITLSFHNWSNAQIQQFIQNAEQELCLRHSSEFTWVKEDVV